MVYSVYTKNPKLTRDRAVLEKIFFRLDFAAEIDYNITVLYGISRCVGMADEGDSKSVSCFFVSVREIHECSLNFESLSKQDFLHPS